MNSLSMYRLDGELYLFFCMKTLRKHHAKGRYPLMGIEKHYFCKFVYINNLQLILILHFMA